MTFALMLQAPKGQFAYVMADSPDEAFEVAITRCKPRAYSMKGIFEIAKDALLTTPSTAITVTSRDGRYAVTLAR